MEQDTYLKIKASVRKLLEIDLSGYKDEQMKRRLDSWLVKMGDTNWDEYFQRIKSQEKDLSKLRDYLTINVTEFFRDIERWNSLKAQVLPMLILFTKNCKTQNKILKIWSAGCSIGAEPYTLLMIMEELNPGIPYKIVATDLDRGALEKAKSGGPFRQDEVKNLSDVQIDRYFRGDFPPYFIKDDHTKKIEFREKNLITDNFENDFDLIVCRNVIIYFTTEIKTLLNHKFQKALRNGGVLFLGGTEIISRPNEFGLKNMGISFYQKSDEIKK
jgi:chemotaxis protein methyltransferase CheR